MRSGEVSGGGLGWVGVVWGLGGVWVLVWGGDQNLQTKIPKKKLGRHFQHEGLPFQKKRRKEREEILEPYQSSAK